MKRMLFWVSASFVATAAIAMLLGRNNSQDAIKAGYLNGDLSQTIVSLDAVLEKTLTSDSLLLAANCYRQLGQSVQFREQIEKAQQIADSKTSVDLALALYKIQHGQLDDSPKRIVDVLLSAGALESDAYSVVVQGAFATQQFTLAKELLDNWRRKQPNSGQMQYLTAVYLNLSGQKEEAAAGLIETIERHPRHELSWLALSELYTRPPNVRFLQSELLLDRFASLFPHNTEVRVRLSKIRRRLGHSQASQSELSSAKNDPEILERANVDFDLGNYRNSVEAFRAARISSTEDFKKMIDNAFNKSLQGQGEAGSMLSDRVSLGATALSLSGNSATATTVFDLAANRTARLRRLQDLRAKQAMLPSDQSLVREMNAVASLSEQSPSNLSPRNDSIINSPGSELYQTHCANCHGATGDGFGRAASNLFPPPRRFRDEPMRMISSKNGVASDADIAQSIRRGQTGTSMPAFQQFSDSQIASLVELLREFIKAGLRSRYQNEFPSNESGDRLAESQWIAARSHASEPIALTDLTNVAALAARGREVFRDAGCGGCHEVPGQTVRATNRLFDSLGRPIKAPNLGRSEFHGGDAPTDIYKRIALGIPGTPHPALTPAQDGDLKSLVAYIVSIRTARPDAGTNNERRKMGMR